MPLEFLNTRWRYRAVSRSVVVAAICNGRLIDVVIPRAVLELVGRETRLSEEDSMSVASENEETLRRAASLAAARNGAHTAVAVIEPGDVAAIVALENAAAV